VSDATSAIRKTKVNVDEVKVEPLEPVGRTSAGIFRQQDDREYDSGGRTECEMMARQF